MKRNIKFIYIGLLSFLIAGLYSCNEFEEFESIPANAPSTVELTTGEVGDSSIVVNVTNSSSGYVVAGIAESSSVEVGDDFDAETFVKQNVGGYDFKKSQVSGGEAVSMSFDDLVQNTEYIIVVVGTNTDGVASQQVTEMVTTSDSYSPSLVETTPSPSLNPVLSSDGSLTVSFDEPVNYDETKTIEFYGYLSDVTETFVSVEITGNEVVIVPETAPAPSDIVFVSWEEGTFSDANGNSMGAMESGLDDENVPYGLYFGVVPHVYEAISVTPDTSATVLPTSIEVISIEFDESLRSFDESLMKIIYNYQNGDIVSKAITADMVTINGNILQVELPLQASAGQRIDFIAEEGAIYVGVGNSNLGLLNPSAEMEISWVIEHPLQTWLGSYTVEAISYGSPGEWDEEWEVTISPSAGDLNTLLISGIAGGENAIEAVFDDELMTVTINSGANIGDAYGYGDVGVYNGNSDLTVNEGEPIVGNITEDGGITIDLVGLVLLEDPNTGYVWDVFDTIWTHQ